MQEGLLRCDSPEKVPEVQEGLLRCDSPEKVPRGAGWAVEV